MPEIKQNFSSGKMNQDLDERLIPSGEYREALNVEISTSEDSDVGALQTLKGNTKVSKNIPSGTSCVGSIADEKNNNIYALLAGEKKNTLVGGENLADYIIEYNTDTEETNPVLVDVYKTCKVLPHTSGNAMEFFYIDAEDLNLGVSHNVSNVRPGMMITGVFNSATGSSTIFNAGRFYVDRMVYVPSTNTPTQYGGWWKVYFEDRGNVPNPITEVAFINTDEITFTAERVLNFNEKNFITGINVIDEMLFWTDGVTEPKSININKIKQGVNGGWGVHTFFNTFDDFDRQITYPSALPHNVLSFDNKPSPIETRDITVVKQSPLYPPRIIMSSTTDGRFDANGDQATILGTTRPMAFYTHEERNVEVNDVRSILFDGSIPNYLPGDTIILTNDDVADVYFYDNYKIKASILESTTNGFKIRILSRTDEPLGNIVSGEPELEGWRVLLNQDKPLFEFKFPRFAYRYRYQDGEYSAFSPFSELAFLPGPFDYKVKDGHNLGMVNNLRFLQIADFVPDRDTLPKGVVSIDILYKESTSPTVYTVKTINATDIEWSLDGSAINPNTGKKLQYLKTKGLLEIKSDMIHAVVPDNQLLRPWDNVPRMALSQEVVGNRLVYANYLQGYNLLNNPRGNEISKKFIANIESVSADPNKITPNKSIKSLRNYQLGVVFRDTYGRETPVFSDEKSVLSTAKDVSSTYNSLVVEMENEPPYWAHSYKVFVKETSNEYYNICMARWYDAEDSNIWLAFPSSERNKVDEETFIILKKAQTQNKPTTEKAKFKILAIENEAPEYIKTQYDSIGGAVTLAISGITTGNEKFFLVALTAWDDTPWYDPLKAGDADLTSSNAPTIAGESLTGSILPKENLVVRFVIGTDKSKWYDVSSVNMDDGQGRNNVKISISKSFGESVLTYVGSGQKIEFAQKVVKNTPEFDGKFFVRIAEDAEGVVKNKIKSVGLPSPKFSPTLAIDHYYLNNNDNSGYEPNNPDYGSSSGRVANFWEYYWNKEAWFIDEESRRGGGNTGLGNSWPFPEDNGYGITGNQPNKMKGCTMELSLCKIKDEEKNGFDTSSNSINNQEFMEEISQVGTLFRWKQDPYQHIYRVTECKNSYNTPNHPHGAGILNYSEKRYARKKPNNKTIRLYLKFVFTGWRLNALQSASGTYEEYPDEAGKYPFNWNGTYEIEYGTNSYVWNPTLKGYIAATTSDTANETSIGHNTTTAVTSSADTINTLQIVSMDMEDVDSYLPENPAVWETEPKEDIGLDIYHEASQAYPIVLSEKTNELFAPNGSIIDSNHITPPFSVGGGATDAELKLWFPNFEEEISTTFTNLSNTITIAGKGRMIPSGTKVHYKGGGTFGHITNSAGVQTPTNSATVLYHGIVNSSGDTELTLDLDNGVELPTSDSPIFLEYVNKTYLETWHPTDTSPTTALLQRMRNCGVFNVTKGIVVDQTSQYSNPMLFNHWNLQTRYQGTSTLEDFLNTRWGGTDILFKRLDGTYTSAKAKKFFSWDGGPSPSGIDTEDNLTIRLDSNLFNQPTKIPYFNCYSYGNGVESNRIRDDFNAATIDKGVKVSTVLAERYKEEEKRNGLIYSGIYNSTSGVNNLNQFIQAEKITKDVNPTYGSIQKLFTRDTDLVTFCEDKVLKIMANKDAIYNADLNPQLIASDKVLGNVTTFAGEFGISRNPESFAQDSFRMYFADKQRRKVLRLSGNGITPISEVGMGDFFNDNLDGRVGQTGEKNIALIGSIDDRKNEYNLTILNGTLSRSSGSNGRSGGLTRGVTGENGGLGGGSGGTTLVTNAHTLSFSEKSKGWVSFKDFTPDNGLSINNEYYTFNDGLWKHHSNEIRNNFYGDQYMSKIQILFNPDPGVVKSFGSLNYEGTQARITENIDISDVTDAAGNLVNSFDGEYYNNIQKEGWYIEGGNTDMQLAGQMEFKDKEGKWFSYMRGLGVKQVDDLNSKEFSFQGIDLANAVTSISSEGEGEGSTGTSTGTGTGTGLSLIHI